MSTINASRSVLSELPIPDFFTEKTLPRMNDIWWPDYQDLATLALEWKKKHDILSPAMDEMKIALVGIDQQLTFIHPKAQ